MRAPPPARVPRGSRIAAAPDLRFRRLGPAEAPAYRALRLRGLREHPDAFTSSYDEEAAKPLSVTAARLAPDGGEMVFGAFAGETLAGVAGLRREARSKSRHKAVLFGMYVAAEHARRGIGAALLAHVIAEARRQPGLEQLVLTVTDSNAGARALYERAGFASFGVEPRALRVGGAWHDKNHMILFLASP